MNEGLKLRGDVIIERRRGGVTIDREELHNLVVNTGKERVAKLINGVSTTPFNYLAIGTGAVAPAVGNTALGTEVTRSIADNGGGTYEASYKAVLEKIFTFGSGESYAITEAGVFDSGTETGSVMFDRFTFSAKNVDADTDLFLKVTITVA